MKTHYQACTPCPCLDGTEPTCSDANGDTGKWVCADGSDVYFPGCQRMGDGETCRQPYTNTEGRAKQCIREHNPGAGRALFDVRVVNGLPYPISINWMWHKGINGDSYYDGEDSNNIDRPEKETYYDAQAYGRPVDKCSVSDWKTIANMYDVIPGVASPVSVAVGNTWWIQFTT